MPRKWDVEKVHRGLDRIELTLQNLKPTCQEALAQVDRLSKNGKLPKYVTDRLAAMRSDLAHLPDRAFASVGSARNALPEVARTRTGKAPRLFQGARYQVVMGGCSLSKNHSPYPNVFWPTTQRLHVGDVVTYRGFDYVPGSQGYQLGKQKYDLFELEGFDIGGFEPCTTGRAERLYLRKIK